MSLQSRTVTPLLEESRLRDGTPVYVAFLKEEPGLTAQAESPEAAIDELMRLISSSTDDTEDVLVFAKSKRLRMVTWHVFSGGRVSPSSGSSGRRPRYRKKPRVELISEQEDAHLVNN